MQELQEIITSRWAKLTLLGLGLGTLLWVIFWLVLRAMGINDFPMLLQIAVAYLSAGLLITRYLSQRIF